MKEEIYLRLMEMSDVPHKVRWINDPKVRQTLNFTYPISEVGTEQWLRKVSTIPNRKDFVIALKESDRPIGYAGLLNIDILNSKAESYMGIGEHDMWGKGYGTAAKRLLLEYAFDELFLNKVYSLNHDDNKSMIKINNKLGGKCEGILRDDIRVGHNKFKNKILLSILRSEFIRD